MEQPKKTSLLTLKNQEKVLLCIIAQKLYCQIIPMTRSGYKITPTVLEAMKWSRQWKQLLPMLLVENFPYQGDYAILLSFLNETMGSNATAEYIIHAARQRNNTNQKYWLRLLNMLSDEQLEKNHCWDILAQKEKWDILEKNRRFDEIILSENVHDTQTAANILFRHEMIGRIIELKKFDWLKYIPDGEDILLKYGKFEILYFLKQMLSWKKRKEMFDQLCQTPEGRLFLYKQGEYEALLMHGHFDLFAENHQWTNYPELDDMGNIYWIRWIDYAHQNNLPRLLENIYQAAAGNGKYQLLANEKQYQLLANAKQYRLLWKNRQFVLCLKSLLANAFGIGKKA